jgi:tRNA threonylcarbamoyl adenosine modification protein YeaZ
MPAMILAFDTSSAACTAALFDDAGTVVVARDDIIGRGHAEHLVSMIAEMMSSPATTTTTTTTPAPRPAKILVGVGPGSFTGIRVAIAAAHGLAIGWGAELQGMSSLALLVAGAGSQGQVAAAVAGGHGELFVQQFDAGQPASGLLNLSPAEAAQAITATLVVGSGARRLVEARGWGEARELWPSAANAFTLPPALRSLAPRPVYARAPDARIPEAA